MDDFAECEMQSDGSVLVNCEYMIGEWLTDIVIGYGEHCEVLKPQWLRNEVEEKLRRMVVKYEAKGM
jgi:predicted DNA-binding transcriptional regulator YafY